MRRVPVDAVLHLPFKIYRTYIDFFEKMSILRLAIASLKTRSEQHLFLKKSIILKIKF